MSICFVTTYPLDRHELGGSGWVDRRLISLLDKTFGDVEVVSVTGPEGATTDLGVTTRSAGSVPLEIRGDRAKLLRVAASMLVSPQPYLARKFTAFPGWGKAAALLRQRAAGRKVITSGWPGLVLAEAAGIEVHAHVAHNVESTIAVEHSPGPLKLLGETWRLPRAEHRLLGIPRQVFALSHVDAATLRDWGIAARQLPMPLQPKQGGIGTRAVGFIGKASWPPNERALDALLGPVHQELLALGVTPEYVLAGSGTERYAGRQGVTALGRVAQESEFYHQVGLVLVPRFGASTGISVKMLEAAEYGVASVVPPQLADAVDPKGPWLVAADPASTAQVVRKWLEGNIDTDASAWANAQDGELTAAALRPAVG